MGVLATYTPETETVGLPGGRVLRVRGLTLDDISLLIRAHLDVLDTIFGVVQTSMRGPETGDTSARLILSLAQDTPRLAAQVVAIASDEPDQADAAMKLPFPVIVDALTKIGRLTFEEAGGIEGFVKAFAGLLAGLRPTNALSG